MINEFEEDQRRFEADLNQWIANQGLLTQLRLGWTKSGALGIVGRLAVFVFVILVLGLLVGFLWLNNHVNKGGLIADLRKQMNSYYQPATPVKTGGGYTDAGAFKIDRLTIKDPKNGFFKLLKAREISIPMELGQGVWRPWASGAIKVNSLDIVLHSKAENSEQAAGMRDSLFVRGEKFHFNTLKINELKLSWAGQLAEGELTGRGVTCIRDADDWIVEFDEGTIDYVWLEGLELGKTSLRLTREALVVNEMKILGDKGTATIRGSIDGALDPIFDLSLELKALQMNSLLPADLRKAVTGRISGSGEIVGNLDGGVTTTISVSLDEENGDRISLWNDIPVLDAMSYLDPSGRYARLPITSGSAMVKHSKNLCSIEDIKFRTPTGARVEGDVMVRPPSQEEIDLLMSSSDSGRVLLKGGRVFAGGFSDSSVGAGGSEVDIESEEEDDRKTRQEAEAEEEIERLRRNALAEGAIGGKEMREARQSLEQVLELRKRRVIEGDIRFGISADVVRRQPVAQRLFEPKGGVFWIKFPVQGEVGTLGAEISDKIREISRNRNEPIKDEESSSDEVNDVER